MKKQFDVLGLGACAVDFLGIVPSYPRPDTKNKMIRFIRQGGGPVATALVALSRLGAKVGFLGKLGKDELSRSVIEEFKKEGIDTSGIIIEKGAGPYFAFISVDKDSGHRTIWWTDQMVKRFKRKDLSKDFITSAKILHLDEYDLEAAIIASRWARDAGMKVVLDAETSTKKNLLPIIKLIDYLVIPEEFALGFTGLKSLEEAGSSLLELGPKAIIITRGINGSLGLTREKLFYKKAFKVKVVDTTGCGDVFHGAFVYGLLKDWPLELITEFASACAALKCRGLGGRSASPTLSEVKQFLKKNGSGEIKRLGKVEMKAPRS